jgi:ribose-phosphate pyrophosphokinase
MTDLVFLSLGPGDTMFGQLVADLGARRGQVETRTFPDGESYVRLLTDVSGADVAILCSLVHPNDRIVELLLLSQTAKELGARRVGLVAPYLAYMRQDKRFRPGEAVSAGIFAGLISRYFDWLVTLDPHLHRYASLSEIYSIPTRVAHAAPAISDWIATAVEAPVVIGPDSESEQWVAEVAAGAKAPFFVLAKERTGDRNVTVRPSGLERWPGGTPVVVDDIVSSGQTMIETVRVVRNLAKTPPVCVAVHALFSAATEAELVRLGSKVVSTNTVGHPTNAIDVSEAISGCVQDLVGR